jgi:ribosome maturation factor RimP
LQLLELIEKTVAGLGYELVDVREGAARTAARLYRFQRPDAEEARSITVEDCEKATHQLSHVLTVENVLTSVWKSRRPGWTALKKLIDFVRFAGCEAVSNCACRCRVRTTANLQGVLREPEGENWSLEFEATMGRRRVEFHARRCG